MDSKTKNSRGTDILKMLVDESAKGIMSILNPLLNSAMKGREEVGKLQEEWKNKPMLEAMPIEQLVKMATNPSATVSTANQTTPAASPTGNVNPAPKPVLNPYQKGVEKALKQAGETQTAEALQQGVPPEHIVQQSGVSAPVENNTISATSSPNDTSAVTAEPIAQNQQLPTAGKAKSFMSSAGVDETGFYNEGAGSRALRFLLGGLSGKKSLEDAMGETAVLQKLMGKEPIQPKDILQQEVELQKANAATSASDMKAFRETYMNPLAAESVKQLSQVERAITASDDIVNLLGIKVEDGKVSMTNTDLLKNPTKFLSKNRQQLVKSRDLMINQILRRDSGAAIGEKEEAKASKIFGFNVGMKAFLQNPSVVAKMVMQTRDQLLKDRNRLSPNEENRKLFEHLRQQYSLEEVKEYFTRTGRW